MFQAEVFSKTKERMFNMGPKKPPITLIRLMSFALLHEICQSIECPKAMHRECNRELQHFYERLYINSTLYNINFLCDTKTDGGGWIIFHRRINNDVSFDKTWKAYKEGFGQICGDHWLGNENIHRITSNGRHELRIDIVLNNLPYHAVYSDFFIENESHGYRLNFRKFVTGNMKDTLKFYNGQQFSTLDRDNDLAGSKHCARTLRSGWWYTRCLKNDTDGLFPKNYRSYEKLWESLIGDRFSLDSLEVKMRKV
ncbi:Ryncolin-4 [Bulinus truncatus]|nr:Ryncolin-4 [Bulinus truncatus]